MKLIHIYFHLIVILHVFLTLSLHKSVMETIMVVPTFESVDESYGVPFE